MDDNGYDISDYQDISSEFGTLEDMEFLISEAKKRNIKILMDLVVNHTSDEHIWFIEAKSSRNNLYRDFYIWQEPKPNNCAPSNMKSFFAGSAWEFDENSNEYYFHLFSRKQPDLNWKNPNLRSEIYKMMNWWIEKGIGGFRMDVIDLIGKEVDENITVNGPNLHTYLKEMNKKTFGNKDLLTVGETWGVTPEIAKLYSDPKREELSMVFQFEHITLCWDKTHGKWKSSPFDLLQFKQIINKWQTALQNTGWNSLFWNNHDLPRVVSKYGDTEKYRIESAKMLATILHMLKGTPYIYQGEEIGMTNIKLESPEEYKDIETTNFYNEKINEGFSHQEMMKAIWDNSRGNARTPMQWNSSRNGGFTKGNPWMTINENYIDINVEQSLQDTNSIFYHYQKLISLRKEFDEVVYGDFRLILENHPQIFAYLRSLNDKTLLIIGNFSGFKTVFDAIEEIGHISSFEILISNYLKSYSSIDRVELDPFESIVIRLN